MNGRFNLFSRCFIGLLAYFFCGLVSAASFINTDSGKETGDPVGFTYAYAASVGYGVGGEVMDNTCPAVPEGGGCIVKIWAKSATSGVSIMLVFVRLKKNPCEEKKGKSAGDLLVPLPYSGVDGVGVPIITSADGLSSFFKSRASSCDGTCELVMSGSFSNGDKLFAIGDDKKSAYALLKMQYSGDECNLFDGKKAPQPPSTTSPPAPNKTPKFPGDCPANSSFGQVNGVNACAKNPPNPTDPAPPPKPTDKDKCVANCGDWDPKKPAPDGTGTGGTGGGTGGGGHGGGGGGGGGGTGTGTGTGEDGKDKPTPTPTPPPDSSITGSCDSFKCKNNDPATCEIARLAWLNKCESDKGLDELNKSELKKAGDKSIAGDDMDGIRSKLNFGENGAIDMTDVIKRDTFLTKGGLSDVSFSVMGKSFSIPFSSVNKYLEMMGKIAVAFSLLAAARILSSSI
ncbi:hypothetical protein R6242_20095 [Iodobacter sp. CM08]|uniref:hypothetical protein n=1 Tax=Iodobacter sp. CM08 TaxID=3085902 RepID=UPI002982B5AA|nr:hypothetical protein [Iodobacter sp. CM08]MDW5418876.1 hypothetical protein [Iodobacter sp. CM08]